MHGPQLRSRMVELGEMPAMIACYDQQKRLWFARAPIVPSDFWPLPQPGAGSVASGLLKDASAIEPGPTLVDADEWLDRAGAAQYSLVEDSVRAGAGTVLTLLWWKNEAQILDADGGEDDVDRGLTGRLTFGRPRRLH